MKGCSLLISTLALTASVKADPAKWSQFYHHGLSYDTNTFSDNFGNAVVAGNKYAAVDEKSSYMIYAYQTANTFVTKHSSEKVLTTNLVDSNIGTDNSNNVNGSSEVNFMLATSSVMFPNSTQASATSTETLTSQLFEPTSSISPIAAPTYPAFNKTLSVASADQWVDYELPGSDGVFKFTPTAISYTPFNNDPNNWCRSPEDVQKDLQDLYSKGIREIRLYGSDCNVIVSVYPAAAALNMTIVQGFYLNNMGINSADGGIADFTAWVVAGGNVTLVPSILIGNEAVMNGWVTAGDLVAKIKTVRAQLRAVGYNGAITTAEIPGVFIAYPELCAPENVDYVAVNAHPYFNAGSSAELAGAFMAGQVGVTQNACPGQYIRVVETGYPHSGNVNGNQVPSIKNQGIAITHIYNTLRGDCILFSMWDDYWKHPGQFNVEWYFGIYHHFSSA